MSIKPNKKNLAKAEKTMDLIIAIDGGGTKTDMVLFQTDGTAVAHALAEGCNPNDFGWKHTKSVIETGLDHLLKDFGGRRAEFLSAFAGISGGSVGDNRKKMNVLLKELLPNTKKTYCDSDAVNALSSGLGLADGCVVISGTGSSGFVRNKGCITRVGGWGYLFDKGGSGYDLGRDAVYYAACDADGRGEKTLLKEMIEEQLEKPFDLAVTALYEKGKPAIASLAPLVFAAAEKNDFCAVQILRQNGQELAKLMNALSGLVGQECCKTVLAGSVFRQWDIMKSYVQPHLHRKHEFIFPELPPVYGSAVEAASLAEIPADEMFKKNFKTGIAECPLADCR